MLALVALAAAVAVVVVRAQPRVPVTQMAQFQQPGPVATGWLASSLGRPDRTAPLVRQTANLQVKLGAAGVAVRRGRTAVGLATLNTGRVGSWQRHANGIARPTSFGRETITIDPKGTEIFLRVDRRQGAKLWSWQLSGNTRPALQPDGSVRLQGDTPLQIRPVKIYDGARGDVTPAGSRWQLTRAGKNWQLNLKLDDAHLPVPYVIDPLITNLPCNCYATPTVSSDSPSGTNLQGGSAPDIVAGQTDGARSSGFPVSLGTQATPTTGTIEAWVQTSDTGFISIWSNRPVGGAPGSLDFGMLGGAVFFYTDGGAYVQSSRGIADSSVHHVVLTVSGGSAAIYIDGVQDGAGTLNPVAYSGTALLGQDAETLGGGGGTTFTGTMDEVATYGSALSPARIQRHYAVGSDGVGPTINVTSASPDDTTARYTQQQTAHFEFDAPTDPSGVASVTCQLTGQAVVNACTSPQDFPSPPLAEGTYSFTITATDNVGNARTWVNTWTVDRTAPLPSITTVFPTPAGPRTQTVNFTTTPADPSTWQCKLDTGAFAACGSGTAAASDSTTLTGLTDGSHTITVHAVDRAGNVSATDPSATWTVDGSNPNVTVSATQAGYTNSTSSQTITLSAADVGPAGLNASTHNFTEATGPLAGGNCTYGAPVNRTATALPGSATSGTYTTGTLVNATCYRYVYTINDNANPANTGTAQVEIKVDTTPPGAGAVSGAAAVVRGTVALSDPTASDTHSTVADVRYQTRPNGSAIPFATLANGVVAGAPYSYSWDTTVMAEGTYDLRALVTDAAGNTSPTATIVVAVDNSGPTVSPIVIAAGTTTAATTTDVTFAASDPHGLANPVYSVRTAPMTNGACGAFTAYGPLVPAPAGATGTTTVTLADATCYQFRYTVQDSVGNTSDPAESAVLKVDQTPPAGGIPISPMTGNTVARPITFNVTAQDNQLVSSVLVKEGATTVATLSLVAGTLQSGTWSGVWASPSAGTHTLTIVITDLAGSTQLIPLVLTVTAPSSVAAPAGIADRTPPSAPRNFRGQMQPDGLYLQWDPATDNSGRIGQYYVWIDGVKTMTLDGSVLQAAIGAFTPDDRRIFQVDASDPAVNIGPFAPALTGVPSVLGQQLDAAKAAIVARGFAVGSVTTQPAPEAPGTVLSQAPASPGVAVVGSAIDLVVSQQGGQAQLVMNVTAAHRVLLAQRNFIAVRVELSIPAAVRAALLNRKSHSIARWNRSLGAGATIVRLTLPRAVRHTGIFRLRVDAAGGGQTVRRTIAIRLVGPSKAKAEPIKKTRVDVVLVNGPDLRTDIALGLNQRFTLRYVAGRKVFDVAAATSTAQTPVAVAVVDVTADTLGVIHDLHLLFPELRIIAVADSSVTAGLATGSGASLVLTKPVSAAVIAASIQALSNHP